MTEILGEHIKRTKHRMKWRRASASQRAALRKNSMRAHSAGARVHRLKSYRAPMRRGGRKVI